MNPNQAIDSDFFVAKYSNPSQPDDACLSFRRDGIWRRAFYFLRGNNKLIYSITYRLASTAQTDIVRLMHLRFLILLAVLCVTNHCPAQPSKTDPQREVMAGQKLSADQISDLEAAVAKNPDDLSTRTELLGYYFIRQYSSPEAREGRQKHIFWIIKNHPEAPIAGLPYSSIDPVLDGDAYKQARQLWLEQTKAHAQNTTILGNAVQFFLIHDKDLAEDLLKQAQKAEPNNPHWPERLGHLYALPNGEGKAAAAKSLKEFEKAQSIDTSELSRFHRLNALAKQAFEAGEIEKASKYANELLETAQKYPQDWNYGNAIHHGNNVLGRVALKQGDVKQADEYLLKAGQTTGSPTLDSFGPNMSLAKELLEKGEKNAVLQYFELCRKFWSMGAEKLDTWTKEAKAGKTPDFGANLLY
jgi:tetratricopeptide (TPR) repeat protein